MIGIIYCNELNMCPYIQKYIDLLEQHKVAYKVLLWNRTGEVKQYPSNYIVYNKRSELYIPKWKKIRAFAGYTWFLYTEIRKQKFDKLIMLTTLPAVICSPLLLGRYRARYIYDFRDMSFERFILFRKLVEKLIRQSFFTCISSPGYKTVIKGRMIYSHNFRDADLEQKAVSVKPVGDKIRLLHIGIARGEEYNMRLADLFGDDDRFEVVIAGTGNDTPDFIRYVSKYKNISVTGTYNNNEKRVFIENCDALLYYYPCSFNNNRALANKYYDGMIYMKPLIGNCHTYSGKRVQKKGLGISVDINDDNVPKKIHTFLRNLDVDQYKRNVEKELKLVVNEDQKYKSRIYDFISF